MKWWFGGGSQQKGTPGTAHPSGVKGKSVPVYGARPAPSMEDTHRQSRGLEQFLQYAREMPPSAILDLGGANQANITFLANLGHRISAENLLHSLDSIWNDPDVSDARKVEDFLEQTLHYQEASFGGALVWDTLEYLPDPLLEAVLQRLSMLLTKGAPMLTFFHADERSPDVPTYTYRIVDSKTLLLGPAGIRTRSHLLNNRAIERMFNGYGSLKFFLTKDSLREVLIKR